MKRTALRHKAPPPSPRQPWPQMWPSVTGSKVSRLRAFIVSVVRLSGVRPPRYECVPSFWAVWSIGHVSLEGMPRYFFNILRGKTAIPDPDGDVFRSDIDAIRHGSMVAREMLRERRRYGWPRMERSAFEITTGAGRKVATVPFSDPKRK
jgi:hypothetical protein